MPETSPRSDPDLNPKPKHTPGPMTGADLQSLELWQAGKIAMGDLTPRARLYAAAPDLADALEWIGRDECAGPEDGMPICREGLPGKQMPKDLWCFRCWARAALSKAGRQT